ncbi:helix-turn-helix protein [Actinocorallia herbida]|uniref:Helix-turn-helix protein n=1 Tax=Actinocorallia herbida TaxID=58109 RepID=A0A3N1D5P3_9ACTN|nr:helix-turn-helix transcriptional regulator [Actinocorallia herbida]ROO88857.1 helix-turn-helix protein [Actinocorallia herbida]
MVPPAPATVLDISASAGGGPTVLRILLGAQLRRLREAKGISRDDAGYAIRASDSKISRLELGRVSFRERDVADLLTLYGVQDEEERAKALSLARRASRNGWWHRYNDVLPKWFENYIGLEEAASRIRSYEVQFVPGLLQTEAYARAVTLLGHSAAPAEEIERRVEMRMQRQGLLTGEDAPQVWTVVDEAAMRRPLGGRTVMREQLARLIELSEAPGVTVQVVPFARGGHAAAGGPFSILRFAEPDLPDIVYLEQLTSALYLDKRDDVERYLAVMDQLCVEAEPVSATADVLTAIRNEL